MTTEDQMQVLFKSIRIGNLGSLQSLLQEGCDPDACCRNTSALIFAVVENKIKCVKLLIENDVTIDKKDPDGKTAAMFACIYNKRDMLSLLQSAGADLNLKSNNGMTACMYAAQHKSLQCLSFIVENADIDLNDTDLQGYTALMFAIKHGSSECLEFIIDKGVDINATDNQGQSPLYNAIYNEDLETANFLIERGASVNIQNISGNTPLSIAFEFIGHSYVNDGFKFIERLLLNGARPNALMCNSSYLHEMIAKRQSQIVRLMIINGFKPVLADCTSEVFTFDVSKPLSPLSVALLSDSTVNIAKYLIANSFLTHFDIWKLPNDKDIHKHLTSHSHLQCLDLMKSMSSSALHLFTLSFISVSDLIQTLCIGQSREYVEELPFGLPEKLLFKTQAAFLCPNTWENLPINFSHNRSRGSQVSKDLNVIFWPLTWSLTKCKCVLCSKSPGYKLTAVNKM